MLPSIAAIAAMVPAVAIAWAGGDLAGHTISGDTIRLDRQLTIDNRGPAAIAFDRDRDLIVELVGADGRAHPLPGGRNRGAAAPPLRIEAGGGATIAVRATLNRLPGAIDWRGDDGLAGRWQFGNAVGPWQLRLRIGQAVSAPIPLW